MRAHEFITETINTDILNKRFKHKQVIGDYTYTASVEIFLDEPLLNIKAYDGTKEIGHIMFEIFHWEDNPTKSHIESGGTIVEPAYQNKGVASTMYAYAKMLGNDIRASSNRTDHGKAMWAAWEKSGDARHITGAVEENFAEGAYPDKKYTIKKSYTMSKDGVEKSVWYIMDGDFVVDATDLRRDAKYYADKWNAAEKESSNASQNLHKQGVAEGMEHYDGIEISMEKEDDEIMVKAMMPGGRELGHVLFVQEGDYLMPQDLEVDERYQGQGIAATMYDYVKSKGYKIRRSGQQTDAGAGFWDKHRPEQNVWENFADGKNPGRKGLAKRSGVNTKASVSSLRKTAKNSSGEKQRMAHWLANMKAGRAKAKRK